VLRELEVTTLTAALRAERGIVSPQGAYVTAVSERVRDEIGLEEGDVILQINRTVIRSANDVSEAISQAPARTMSRALIERRGRRYITDFAIR
jgi:serine protease Do